MRVWVFQSLLEWGTKYSLEKNMETKCRAETEGITIHCLPNLWIHPHIQTPNPVTIVDTNTCLLTGAKYGYLLRSSAISWQEKRLMLTDKYQTDHGVPSRQDTGRTEGAEWVCNLIGRTTI